MSDNTLNRAISLYFEIIKFENLENTKIYHEKYNILLVLLFFGFGFVVIYAHHLKKNKIRNDIQTQQHQKIVEQKEKLVTQLTYGNLFRCISLIYVIIFYNKTGLDIFSFINYFFHVYPSFIFLLVFEVYIGFIIEKYYQTSSERTKILILPTLKLILYFSIILIISLSILTLILKNYTPCFYLTYAIMGLNYLLLGFLYLFYGSKIILFYSREINDANARNIILKRSIFFRMIPITYIVGLSYLFFGAIFGLVSIGTFGTFYPNFLELNLFDFFLFLFCELLSSIVVGYSQQNKTNTFIEYCSSGDFQDVLEELKSKNIERKNTNKALQLINENKMEDII